MPFQVRVFDKIYRYRFKHVLHVSESENSLLSVSTMDLKGFTNTFGREICLISKA